MSARPLESTYRQAAYLYELATLGCYAAKAAALLRIKKERVSALRLQFDIPFVRQRDGYTQRRGYLLPDELRPRYHELRRLGLTMEETGVELGLIERKVP